MSVCLPHHPARILPSECLVPASRSLPAQTAGRSLLQGVLAPRHSAEQGSKEGKNTRLISFRRCRLLFEETSQVLGLTSQNLPGLGVIAFA